MIRLIDEGPDKSTIEFSPRSKVALKNPEATFTKPLIYGHICSWCNNVIQAMFLTDKEVNLGPYEQTNFMGVSEKTDMNVIKIVPNKDDRKSAYKVDFYVTTRGNGQLIRMKNHIINWKGLSSPNGTEDYLEVGHRCCKFAGIYCLREEDLVNELAAISNHNIGRRLDKPKITLEFVQNMKIEYEWTRIRYRLAEPVGWAARPLMLVEREAITKPLNSNNFSKYFNNWDTKLELDKQLALQQAKETPLVPYDNIDDDDY